jgi:phosphatidylinositol alpha-mannosyltransferase
VPLSGAPEPPAHDPGPEGADFQRLRICSVVPYDLADEGGVKRHALHLAAAMRAFGDEVTIVGPLSGESLGADIQGFGGVFNVPANGAANRMALFTPPWAVRDFFGSSAFDVVHIHEPLVPLLAWYALRFSPQAAHVCTFHMYAEEEPLVSRAARGLLARSLFPSFERAIAVSAPAAEYAARVWTRPLRLVPNGVPTGIFRPRDPGSCDAGEEVRLLFVGNGQDKRKGLRHLLDAVRILRGEGLPLSLDVVGGGRLAETPPGVVFRGRVPTEEALAEYYRRCDIFVSPATGQESFGIVLLEAMSSARPVVCSDIVGYRQVADPAGARFVPPSNPAALARAIGELARRPDLRQQMGAFNRTRALAFDWDRLVRQVREEYLAALAARPQHATHASSGPPS